MVQKLINKGTWTTVYLGKGNRGKHPKIIVNNYVYNMHKQNENGKTRWRCSYVNMSKCKAVLYTLSTTIHSVREHNHTPPAEHNNYQGNQIYKLSLTTPGLNEMKELIPTLKETEQILIKEEPGILEAYSHSIFENIEKTNDDTATIYPNSTEIEADQESDNYLIYLESTKSNKTKMSKRLRKTNRGSWTAEAMEKAITAVKEGKGVRQSAKIFGIPYSTLKDRLKVNNSSKPQLGRYKPIFTSEEENDIVEQCVYLSKTFYGLTTEDLKRNVYEYAVINGITHRFNENKKMAGKDWFGAFIKRHSQIGLRKLESTSLAKVSGFNQENVNRYFTNLSTLLKKLQIGPHRMYNVDETEITTVPTKAISPQVVKQPKKAVSHERGTYITVCCCVNVLGSFIPPMFIYPGEKISEQLKKNGPVGAIYSCSSQGWMTEELFIEWLQHFKVHTSCSNKNPVLLILDNHTSHCSLKAYNFCRKNGITMISFPPHTNHKLQPLDLTVFGPLKKAYSNELSAFMKNHPYQKITPNDVAEIFNSAFIKSELIEKAQNGFQISGIWPFNSNKFSSKDFLPGTISSPNIATMFDSQDITEKTESRTETSNLCSQDEVEKNSEIGKTP